MADISNQLKGVDESLERFLDALDNASIKMSSNAALETKFAKVAGKMSATNQKFDKNLLKSKKENLKLQTDLNKGLKAMSAGLKDFGNKALGGVKKMAGGIAKAGIIGGLVVGVKFLIDGLLKVDNAMAGLVKRTKLTRVELAGVREAALAASQSVGLMGPTFEQITAEAGNLVETFGRAGMVSEKLIKDSLALQQGYGVAAGEAGKLTEAIERTARSGEEFRNTIRAIAGKDGVSASLLMRSMAGQAQQIAIQGERGTESMAKMASFALKAGVSLQDMQGMKAAFSDIDSITEGLGQAGVIMGEEFRMAMGNAEELYELNLRGATGREEIQKRLMKAMKATTYYDEKSGELYHKSGKPLAEMEGYMDKVSGFAGQTTEALLLGTREMHKQHLGIQTVISDQEHLESVYRDQLGVLEYFGKIVSSVFGKITTAFSEALGIDSSEGGVRGLLKTLEGDLEKIFQFGTLRKDIASGGGGFGGFVDAMMIRLDPLFEYIKDKFIKAMEMAFAWMSENIKINPAALWDDDVSLISTKTGDAQKALERQKAAGTGTAAGYKELLAGDYSSRGRAGTGMNRKSQALKTTLTDMGFEKGLMQEYAAERLDEEDDVQKIKVSEFKQQKKAVLANIDREIENTKSSKKLSDFQKKQNIELLDAERERLVQNQMAFTRFKERVAAEKILADAELKNLNDKAIAAQKEYDAEQKEKKAETAALKIVEDRVKLIADIAARMKDESLGEQKLADYQAVLTKAKAEQKTWQDAEDIRLKKIEDKEQEDAKKDLETRAGLRALGGIGGGLSIVGEAGGEVVASRSALRSGIGIGGRAAGALAGIGVPGFRTGYAEADVSGIHGRKGLQGALGSQAGKGAIGAGFQKEQARQQAAMMEYWRQHYEDKMDDMVDEKVKKDKEGPPWLATMFIKYNKEIGEQLKKTGPTVSAGLMTGMTKWAQGGSITDAIDAGAKAGILAGINDPNSKLNDLLKKTGEWQGTLTAGLAAFAAGQSPLRAMAGIGSQVLAKKLFGEGGHASRAQELMGMGGPAGILGQAGKFGQGVARVHLPGAATGKYVNSPTLMMVGETGQGEVVIPTERIRKGLPINRGVANELASIGVPGFQDGGVDPSMGLPGADPKRDIAAEYRAEGFGGALKTGAAGALMSFGNVFQQTGDWKQAATAGVGGGIGTAAGFGLTALGIPPPLSGMIGNAIGGLATKGLNKIFNITGGYGKGRRKTIKLIESHIKTGGRFDYGAPGGLNKAINQAIGGYEKTPTEANFQKLVEKMGTSKLVASMGIDPPTLIALGMGQMRGEKATKMFSAINTSLYGKGGGDKYRKALAVSAVPSLAAGGIVNRPTTALIGEAGPEAVVPLRDSEMVQELKKQNKLMTEMIKTQKETAKTEIRMDGRIVAETVGQNMYDIGTGM